MNVRIILMWFLTMTVLVGISNADLYYERWDDLGYRVNALPDFDALPAPVETGTTDNIRDWIDVIFSPADAQEDYIMRFTGYVEILESGDWTFYTTSDDGSKLYIEGVEVVDNDGDHGNRERSGVIFLSKGMHAITITFYEAGGGDNLWAEYEGPGVSKMIIPNTALFLTRSTAYVPDPADGEFFRYSTDVTELSWTNPPSLTGGVVSCDVLWFGTDPGSTPELLVDGATVESVSLAGRADAQGHYWWRVDCYDPSGTEGYLWTFSSARDVAMVFLDESDGSTVLDEQDPIANRDDYLLSLSMDPGVPVSITISEVPTLNPLTNTKETMESYNGEAAGAPLLYVDHAGGVLARRVSSGDDDLEQYESTGQQQGAASSDLEFFDDSGGRQIIGLRFNNVGIDPGAVISAAYVEFEVDETNAPGEVHGIVTGEDVDSAPAITNVAYELRDRLAANPTSATSSFIWPADYAVNSKVPTSDISSVIQEIVNQPGWASGNSIVLFFTEDMNPDAADIAFIAATDPWGVVSSTYVLDSTNWEAGVTVTLAAIDDSELETDPDRITLTATATGAGEWDGLSIPDVIVYVGDETEGVDTLVEIGSTWKYLDDGSDQGTAWYGAGFDDASWLSGPAELGYGDGDEATVVSYGPDDLNKYTTTYFRHTFDVPDPSIYGSMTFNVKRDDGVVVYLNGNELFRDNMPGGMIDYTTLAATTIYENSTSPSYMAPLSVDVSNLVSGTNVLAVEIHQVGGTSSDISFDLHLFAFSPAPAISYTGWIEENFDSIGATGTSLPTGWIAGRLTSTASRVDPPNSGYLDMALIPDDGSSIAKARAYNYGTTSAPDRAIGFLPTTNYGGSSWGDMGLQVALKNDTGAPITTINLTYTGEQWRIWASNSSSGPEILRLYISTTPYFQAGTFEKLPPEFEFEAPQNSPAHFGRIDGNDPANRVENIGGVHTLNNPIPAGATFYITWHDWNDLGTSDHPLAVDDVVINDSLTICQDVACINITDEGSCLAATIDLFGHAADGEVCINQIIPSGNPESITFEMLNTGCTIPGTFEFFLNGVSLGSVPTDSTLSCSCSPPLQSFSVIDTGLIASLWDNGEDNTLRVVKSGGVDAFVAWVRAQLHSGGNTETVCIFDYQGGGCDVMNLCSADYTSSDLDEERTFSDSFTSSVPITCLAYTDGQIPEVRIDISSYPDGEYTLCVTSESSVQCDSEAQAQDNCFDAEPVGPGIYQGSTIGANNDGAGSCFSSPDVWYSYTPISDGLLVVTTCGGANYDTALSIHSGCPGDAGASLLACNDDWCGLQSQISLNVEAFNTYLIRVAGFSNRSGNFTLDISGPPCGGSVVTVQQDCYSFTKQGEDTIALNMPCNIPPVAVCQDVTVSAGADCTADASVDDGSYDPDGDLITLTQDPPGPYPLGNTTVTLIVSDGELLDYCQATITVTDDTPPEITLNGADVLVLECSVDSYVEQGATATDACDDDVPVTVGGDTVDASTCGMYVVIYDASDDSGNPATQVTRTVIVEDTIAPEFSLSVTPDVLWSPNHKMVLITPSWTVSDICDESPAMTLIGITMNEGDNDLGDGNTTDDIQVTDDGLIYLRAERTGKGTDRVYTITYAATDDSGNTTQDTATVTVPHDKGKSKPK